MPLSDGPGDGTGPDLTYLDGELPILYCTVLCLRSRDTGTGAVRWLD